MATNRNPVAPESNGRVITSEAGIVIPPSFRNDSLGVTRRDPGPVLKGLLNGRTDRNSRTFSTGFCYGYRLERTKELIVVWPEKGTGIDDMLCAAIVDGTIANAGISPIVMPQISALVQRQQDQARASDLTFTGRKTPVGKARDAIARANDSPLGYTQFIAQVVYQLRTFNRGAPITTVPVTYPVENWAENGMMAIPLDGGEDETPSLYYLEVDWTKHGPAVPYLPSVFDLVPSGNAQWPYWMRKKINGTNSWVLLHNSQIISVLPCSSASELQSIYGGARYDGHYYPCIGTSAVYLAWSLLAENILMVDADVEQMINRATDGFVSISGVEQTPAELRAEIEAEAETDGIKLMSNYTILTSEEEIKFDEFSFRSNNRDFAEWRTYVEDVLAALFGEPLHALVSRGGLSVQQSESSSDGSADAGVNSILDLIGKVLGCIYPRVQVAVARQNDRAQRLNMDTFEVFSSSIRNLPEGTLTRDEIRAIIDRDIFEIPETGEDVKTEGATADQDDSVGGVNDDDQARSDAELEAVRLMLEDLLYDAWRLETVDEVLESDALQQLILAVLAGIQASYDSVDIPALVDAITEAGIAPDDIEAIAGLIDDNDLMDSAADGTDLDEVLTLLLAVAVMGMNQAQVDADNAGQPGFTAENRSDTLDSVREDYIEPRVDQLYIEATGGDTDIVRVIEDPLLPDTVDAESQREVARNTGNAMMQSDDIDIIEDLVVAGLAASADNRANMIGEIEALRAHGNGHVKGGRTLGARFKRWNMTESQNPRANHLLTVGEIVPFESRFSNGNFFSQEEFQCKCSISILWER